MSAYNLAILAAGTFFLVALITGVWKYLEIVASPEAKAHPYVDIAHRSALMYSFAAILLSVFVQISELPATLEFWAALMPLVFFGLAIASYIAQGWIQRTDNQLRDAHGSVGVFMWALIVAEIGGFSVLFYGVIIAIF
ncbi:MAG: hypothetical protein AAGI11_10085 [Pseudomonadota bacterium]